MKDIGYLLSIKELLDEATKEALLKAAYKKLDSERRRKLENITNEKKRAESIGAGLLLQLAVQELLFENGKNAASMAMDRGKDLSQASAAAIQLLTVSQVLAKLGAPIEIEYIYSENGKPRFRDYPWHFNLSHSEEYVFCVLSEQEVGVDIQCKRTFNNERILRRFFTEEEQKNWEQCDSEEEREQYFYRMWTRKEAYGKMTGEGIAKAVSVNVMNEEAVEKLGCLLWDYEMIPQYRIAVCKGIGEKE